MLRVQERFNFVFGPEHREFIQSAVPVGKSWPDWRNDTDEDLRRRLAWPVEGVLSDVRNSGFWPAFWGDQPDAKDDWEREARTSCPRRGLIPVLSHRYMTSDLKFSPSPVFSAIRQTSSSMATTSWTISHTSSASGPFIRRSGRMCRSGPILPRVC